MDILRCSKCSCYYPKDKHSACPSCNESKHSDTKGKHLTFCGIGLLICFAIGSFFSIKFSAIILGVIGVSYFFIIIREFKKAANNNGYLYPDKIKKKVEESQKNLYRGLERRGPNKPAYQRFSSDSSGNGSNQYDDSFSDFNENLSVIWTGSLIVDFSYRDATGNKTRRSVTLSEINVNTHGEIYLTGYCQSSSDIRHFKADRITSKIEFSGRKYSSEQFLNDVLHI